MLAVFGPLLALVGLEANEIVGRIRRDVIVWATVAGFGLITIVFVLVAIDAALADPFGPVIAPLIIAVVAAVIALVVFLIARALSAAEQRRLAEKKRNADKTALVTTALISAVPLILRSPLVKELAIPAGAAFASALLSRKGDGKGEGRRGQR